MEMETRIHHRLHGLIILFFSSAEICVICGERKISAKICVICGERNKKIQGSPSPRSSLSPCTMLGQWFIHRWKLRIAVAGRLLGKYNRASSDLPYTRKRKGSSGSNIINIFLWLWRLKRGLTQISADIFLTQITQIIADGKIIKLLIRVNLRESAFQAPHTVYNSFLIHPAGGSYSPMRVMLGLYP